MSVPTVPAHLTREHRVRSVLTALEGAEAYQAAGVRWRSNSGPAAEEAYREQLEIRDRLVASGLWNAARAALRGAWDTLEAEREAYEAKARGDAR